MSSETAGLIIKILYWGGVISSIYLNTKKGYGCLGYLVSPLGPFALLFMITFPPYRPRCLYCGRLNHYLDTTCIICGNEIPPVKWWQNTKNIKLRFTIRIIIFLFLTFVLCYYINILLSIKSTR